MPTSRSGSTSVTSATFEVPARSLSDGEPHPLIGELGPTVVPVPQVPLWASRHLFRAAVELFAEKGFHGTSTRDICKKAGTGETAIYDHFSSKEEILYLVIRLSHEEALRRLSLASKSGSSDPITHLKALVAAFASFHAAWPVATRVANHELAALTSEHLEQVRELRSDVERHFVSVLDAGMEQGVFRVNQERATVFAIISMSIGVSRWFRPGGSLTPEELGHQYGEIAVRMVRS